MRRFGYYFIVLFLLGAAILIPTQSGAEATTVSSWFKPEIPVFRMVQPDIAFEQLPYSPGRECVPNTKFITIPKNILKLQPESSYTGCAVQTAFGQQNVIDSAIKLDDTGLSGPVKSAAGSNISLNAIPSSKHIMFGGSGVDGTYQFLVKDFLNNMTVTTASNGSIYYQLKPGVFGTGIKDTAGNLISFVSTRFSDNGKWMIGEVPQRGMTRVNIETGATLVFGPAINHQNGIRPNFISAISGDGRYVITAESRYDNLRIYDLNTCVPNTDQTKTANCQSRDLLATARAQIAGYTLVQHAQFSTGYSIRLHVSYTAGGAQSRYGYFNLTAPGEKESSLDYLALGDSFASGEGAHNYKPGTNVQNPFNKCHLSIVSYPYLLAARTNINAAQSVACAGAYIKDVYFPGDQQQYNLFQKQSSGKEVSSFNSDIYNNFLVGHRPQNNFVQQTKPARVTLSVSGNDIGFGNIILDCIKPGVCYNEPQDRLNLIYTINSKFDDLVKTYTQVKDGAGTDASIYVIGYPLLVDPQGNCAVNVRFEKQELVFFNQLVVYFNSVIKRAAGKAGVSYIDTESAFSGYRLCEADSSELAVNGLTAGDDKTFSIPLKPVDRTLDFYLTGRESYHPNQLGHRLFADVIAGATNNFAAKNPAPITNMVNPAEADAATILPTASLGLAPRRLVFDDKLTNNVLQAGKPNQVQTGGLRPGTDVTVWLRTKPKQSLGTYRTSETGFMSAEVDITTVIKPDFYPIELHARNIVGEEIIIQKTVYIAATADDIDGDGIPNAQEACLAVQASNTDTDKDGTDDACDNFIGLQVVIPDNPPSPLQIEHNTNTILRPNNEVSPLLAATLLSIAPELSRSQLVHSPLSRANDTSAPRYKPIVLGATHSATKLPWFTVCIIFFGILANLLLFWGWWRKRA